jgi:hypothetical protein
MYEWLPWVDGQLEQVPADPAARVAWLKKTETGQPLAEGVREALRRRYADKADAVRNAEAFELCEYGRRPSPDELSRLFPF